MSTVSTSGSSSIPPPAPAEKPPEPAAVVVAAVKEEKKKKAEPILKSQLTSYFVAGGCAGAASRTVVSPLERLKIIQQVQPRTGGKPYKGVFNSLARMWREEGFKGYMRGNGINCVRIIPYSAVQFTSYEMLKKLFSRDGARPLDTPTRLVAGALAGICSVTATYPLDLCRARLSIASASMLHTPTELPITAATAARPTATAPFVVSTASSSSSSPSPSASTSTSTVRPTLRPVPAAAASSSAAASISTSAIRAATATLTSAALDAKAHHKKVKIPGMWGMMALIYREEGGLRALYRGIVPTAVGVAPYVGINFAAYEWLRGYFTPPGQEHHAWQKLSCGALAGSISQSITYPFDVLRRKMQVSGMKSLGPGYNGAFDAIRGMYASEGVLGFYRGLWPNLLKVAPSIATSFYVYELTKEFLQ